jgi:3-hydroxyacyl-CoA dehydrogenase
LGDIPKPTAVTETEDARRYLLGAERQAADVPGLRGIEPRAFARTAVIGAGTMGAGIAVCLADAGLSVLLLERDVDTANAGFERVAAIYARQVTRGRLTKAEVHERLKRISATADWSALRDADLVVEAAFEDFGVKAEIFGRLDELLPVGAVLASNTSYLDLDAIAAVTRRPQDVLGLHFFSPANVMKLLEIVRGKQTAPDVLATGLALAAKLGKQPVVAGVCDGFIGNRIYAAYRRHAEYLVEDGASPQEVDAALEGYGFAMGVFAVSDMSGLDIAFAMRRRRDAVRDAAERYVSIPDRLCEAGRLGRKTNAGWYAYDAAGKKRPDDLTAQLIGAERQGKGIVGRHFSPEEIQTRLIAVMANEGARELAEGIALRASDIDVAVVNGYGFPAAKGGPMWTADRIGLDKILVEVEAAHAVGGAGSAPAPLLIQLARSGKKFGDSRNA